MKLILLAIAIVGSVNAVGHWREVAVDQEPVKNAAYFATKSLSQRMNSAYHSKLHEIHEARQQVVAGMNYKLKLTLGTTNCRKSSVHYDDVEKCDFKDGLFRTCEVVVYRNLEGKLKLTHFECGPNVDKKNDHHQEHEERDMFEAFVSRHNKAYKDDEEKEERFRIFQKNLKKIKLLNDHERGTATYGVTQFADLTENEFKKKSLGLRMDLMNENEPLPLAETPKVQIPDSFDWRTKNVVTEVKNQGQCGSCWAFSTTGNIEGQWALKKKKLVSLSEQELVDCDKVDEGCNGGLPSNAYKEIIRLGGLEGEKDYPYEGTDDKCELKKKEIRVFINSSVAISTNETEMAQWLVKNGPISIGINANAMQFYYGGISHPWKFLCNPKNLDHGVLIVGYGVHTYPIFKKTLPFWIIKNSWGPTWGEQGYYRVYRGDGTCGVNMMATSSIID